MAGRLQEAGREYDSGGVDTVGHQVDRSVRSLTIPRAWPIEEAARSSVEGNFIFGLLLGIFLKYFSRAYSSAPSEEEN